VVGSTPQVSEFAAFTAATSFPASTTNPQLAFLAVPAPGAVVINGITVPFVIQTTIPAGFSTDLSFTGGYFFGPVASPAPVPNGYLINPRDGAVGGLTAAKVTAIVSNAVSTASVTRAVIRLPIGQRTR